MECAYSCAAFYTAAAVSSVSLTEHTIFVVYLAQNDTEKTGMESFLIQLFKLRPPLQYRWWPLA